VQFATFPETVVPYYPYFAFVQRPFEMATEHLSLLEQALAAADMIVPTDPKVSTTPWCNRFLPELGIICVLQNRILAENL
jgi:hypothetical protein